MDNNNNDDNDYVNDDVVNPIVFVLDNDNDEEDNGVILTGACIVLPFFVAHYSFCRQPLAHLQCPMVGCCMWG